MKRKILYVDDESDNLVVFESAFEDDFQVLTAQSGEEALAIMRKTPVPVVVADQRMPKMSGVELFETLRELYPQVKRIILTGYIEPAAMLDAINKGQAYYFVTKPWKRELLLPILIRALEAHDLELANSALLNQLAGSQRLALLGRSAAQIAHEMGNHLGVLPLVEHIEEYHQNDAELCELAGLSRTAHERLLGLIEEVKAFVRFGNAEFPMQSLRLADALHELTYFLRFENAALHSRLVFQAKADPVVRGNRIKLQQVAANLLKNAAHAIRGKAGGKITMTLSIEGDDALITVADNGCGMNAETLDKIWTPFFSTKGDEGNGLGLDICRQFIEGHGGEITCESKLGEGTIFSIRLPLAENAGDVPHAGGALELAGRR